MSLSSTKAYRPDACFSHPFQREYWKCAAMEFKDLRKLVCAALFIALHMVVGVFYIPVADNLRISFAFFVVALGSMIYGPLVGMTSGFISDVLSAILFPSGPFFFGYTLTAMLGPLLYGLFFYRARVGPLRIALSKTLINLFINIGLGSLWSAILYGKGYYYYLATSIVKNTLLLPLEILLLLLFLRAMTPILVRARMIPQSQQRRKAPAKQKAGT